MAIIDKARPSLEMRDPRLCPDPRVSCLSYQTNLPIYSVFTTNFTILIRFTSRLTRVFDPLSSGRTVA